MTVISLHAVEFEGSSIPLNRRRDLALVDEVAGLLRESVVPCCALSCSEVNLQRTSRELGC
jgi:hypothetical protein